MPDRQDQRPQEQALGRPDPPAGGAAAADQRQEPGDDQADTDPAPRVVPLDASEAITPREPIPPPELSVPTLREPAVRRKASNDTVDALLGGLPDKPPLRMPPHAQSDGKDSAAYHGQHTIPAAQTSREEDEKVVVTRAPLSNTMRIVRGAPKVEVGVARAHGPHADPKKGVAGRVALALVAGLAVVAALYAVLSTSAKAPAPPLQAPSGLGTSATALLGSPPMASPSPEPTAMTPAPAESASMQPPATSAATTGSPKPPSGRPKASTAAAAASSGASLGEFKTSFH